MSNGEGKLSSDIFPPSLGTDLLLFSHTVLDFKPREQWKTCTESSFYWVPLTQRSAFSLCSDGRCNLEESIFLSLIPGNFGNFLIWAGILTSIFVLLQRFAKRFAALSL